MLHRSCFPIISFLHVPGKMSQPLWLMLGTAFLISPPSPSAFSSEGAIQKAHSRRFLLTTKHTFAPWDYVADPNAMKVPHECRKQRYVTCRLYNTTMPKPSGGESSMDANCTAIPDEYLHATLVRSHPTQDIALLSVSDSVQPPSPSFDTILQKMDAPLALAPSVSRASAPNTSLFISGFRGEGMLGELETLEPAILDRLGPKEKESLLLMMKDVEGKQNSSCCNIEILNRNGAAVGREGKCYHGMSGSPVILRTQLDNGTTKDECVGMLYGKHPDNEDHIGFLPVDLFYPWVEEMITQIPS